MNDIVHKALYASGLTASERNLAIVEELLNNQMPVDKSTILQLIKLSATYPEASLPALVLMHKNHLPISTNNIAQFEAYQKGVHQILSQLNSLIGNIRSLVSDNLEYSTNAFNNNINMDAVSNIISNLDSEAIIIDSEDMANALKNIEGNHTDDGIQLYKYLLSMLNDGEDLTEQLTPNSTLVHILGDNELMELQNIINNKMNEAVYSNTDIAATRSQLADGSMTLESLLSLINDIYDNTPSTALGEKNLLPSSVLEAFIKVSDNLSDVDRQKLAHLLKSDTARDLLTETLHNRWTLSPNDLTQENKVREFFKRLDKDLDHIKELATNSKLIDTQSTQSSINKLQDNLQFMRDLNELFLYLQLPIRLAQQDVHGDLYVFTRKNQKQVDTDQLNVLLHLDMANLGPMDIHMSMKNKQLNAVFYLEEASEKIIGPHLHELIDTLLDKGYQFQATTRISDSKPDFITDILQPDTPNQSSHRYTFDIRA